MQAQLHYVWTDGQISQILSHSLRICDGGIGDGEPDVDELGTEADQMGDSLVCGVGDRPITTSFNIASPMNLHLL